MCKKGNGLPTVMPAKAGIQQEYARKFEENDGRWYVRGLADQRMASA